VLGAVPFTPSLADYIESFHSHIALSHARLAPEQAAAF